MIDIFVNIANFAVIEFEFPFDFYLLIILMSWQQLIENQTVLENNLHSILKSVKCKRDKSSEIVLCLKNRFRIVVLELRRKVIVLF